jgi:probable dihydroxyacetone kinase regulator
MKHSATTLNTKKAMAASLKKLMEHKPLSKITISDIVKDCGINRKTFYYHFPDIYALLKWMLEQEAGKVIGQFDMMIDYEDAIIFVMKYVNNNKHILNCAYDTMGREGMMQFFYSDFIGIIRTVIDNVVSEEHLEPPEDYEEFICDFYTQAMSGILINWLQGKSVCSPKKTVKYLSNILRVSLPEALRDYPQL